MNSIIVELKKLTNVQSNLEVSEAVLLKCLAQNDSEINSLQSSTQQKRDYDILQFRNRMQFIMSFLTDINLNIGNVQSLDLNQLKKEMIDLQEHIEGFKQDCKSNLEKKNQEEILLSEQLNTYEKKIVDWEKTINTDRIFLRGNSQIVNRKKFAFEVKEYLDYVNQYGHEGGWETVDHNLFLKVRNKIKDIQKLAKYLNSLMPDISVEEVIEHENWFQKYESLRQKQRDVIKQWKSDKAPLSGGKSEKPSLNIYHKVKYDREENMKKIMQWKEKRTEMLCKNEEEKFKQYEIKSQNEKKWKEKNEKIKHKVILWKTEKTDKKLKEKQQNDELLSLEKKQKSMEALKAIKLFQSKDDEFVEKMKKKMEKKTQYSFDLVRSKTCAPRDPKRVLKPTQQWIQRSKREEKDNSTSFFIDIKQIPKLCLPSWRRDVPLNY